jgi:hypothetical protein
MRPECDRTRLIAELASLLRECELPNEARTAGLTLIGFLARQMPGEAPSDYGVEEVRACKARMISSGGAQIAISVSEQTIAPASSKKPCAA